MSPELNQRKVTLRWRFLALSDALPFLLPPSAASLTIYHSYINRTLTAKSTQEVTDDVEFAFNNALSQNVRPEPPEARLSARSFYSSNVHAILTPFAHIEPLDFQIPHKSLQGFRCLFESLSNIIPSFLPKRATAPYFIPRSRQILNYTEESEQQSPYSAQRVLRVGGLRLS